MKAIVEYTDYRKFIRDYYEERKRCSAFTWREFARNVGFSSAFAVKQNAVQKLERFRAHNALPES